MIRFSLENEHGDDLIPGTDEYTEYVRGVDSTSGLVEQAAFIALTGNPVDDDAAIERDGYFGVTILDLGSYAANLVTNRTLNDFTGLYYESADVEYDSDHRRLTVEGAASSSPDFAVGSLLRAAELARELEELVVSTTPLDSSSEK